MVNLDLIPPCGLYCGVCAVYQADHNKDEEWKRKLAKFYSCDPTEISCNGCNSDRRFNYCEKCTIRDCAKTKNLKGCEDCSSFPCTLITSFPVEIGKKIMLRGIQTRQLMILDSWVVAETERYRCPHCSALQFRGVKRCKSCQSEINLD